MPRSGTKLLRDLLNRHPRIGIPDVETEFLPWLVRCVERSGKPSNPAAFDRLYRQLLRQSFFTFRSRAERVVSAAEWYATCDRFDAAGLFEALIRLDVGAPPGSKRIWGDKSPSYINEVPLLDRLYPHARILHIVRDVRDYCVSMNDAWGKDVRRAAQRWADGVTSARRAGEALGPRYAEVLYEDLLREPATVLRRVCAFLDIEFETCMLTLARPSENLGQARGAQHVVHDNQGKFTTRMDPAVIADVESLAGSVMQDFGYPVFTSGLRPQRLSRLQLFLAQLRDGLALVRHRETSQGVFATLVFHMRHLLTTRGRP